MIHYSLYTGCPDPNGEGMRILRFNNELTRWDTAARDEVERRTLDTKNYGLKFGPVSAEDSGTYLCLINNRREPDALLELTVEGENTIFETSNFPPFFQATKCTSIKF